PESDQVEEHTIPTGKRLVVFDGDFIKKGQPLTDGAVVPHEILEVCGPQDLREYLVNQVQEVYRLQGVEINDKHIEIVVRQMMRKVRITDPGTTSFLYGETADRIKFLDENARVIAEGGQPAEAQPILLGITKASLETESFISAASFQDTTRVLTEAATGGAVDQLQGFKENVIMGHLIPAGTGYQDVISFDLEKESPEGPEGEETEGDQEKSESDEDRAAEAKALLDL
ncbi:MAG: DNA-directed RNA polymerase subunit beta', partial [Candidatus Pacebacteria bacterium]|nr:DNA-directed RNA polymerase subunit beta' [Candidatus Paceibacterota bacterium]